MRERAFDFLVASGMKIYYSVDIGSAGADTAGRL